MSKIAIVLGTRPEAIKLIPVYLACKNIDGFEVVLINTGQHTAMIESVFNFFSIKPDHSLTVLNPGQDLAMLTSNLTLELSSIYERIKPDWVIVQGDTTTCFVASLCAFYQKIKIAHVEAGLRTYEKFSPFPEEINRRMVSLLADVHFAPTATARDHLVKEGADKESIFVVGNTVIDSLYLAKSILKERISDYKSKFSEIMSFSDKIILVTGHRRESFGEGFENICTALKSLSSLYPDYIFVYPVHLNPNVQKVVKARLSAIPNLKLLPPLPYDELVFLLLQCKLILSDSGGIQEEGPAFGKPVLVMREHTERPEGIASGCNVLVGTDPENIVKTFREIIEDPGKYSKMSKVKNPYGDGTSAEQIIGLLKKVL